LFSQRRGTESPRLGIRHGGKIKKVEDERRRGWVDAP
jgi:hypothetical protein